MISRASIASRWYKNVHIIQMSVLPPPWSISSALGSLTAAWVVVVDGWRNAVAVECRHRRPERSSPTGTAVRGLSHTGELSLPTWKTPGQGRRASEVRHADTARRTSLARRPRPGCCSIWTAAHRRTCRTTAFRPPMSTLGSTCVPPTVNYLQYLATGSTLTAVGPFQLPTPQSGTLSRISSGTWPSVQIVSDVCLKRACSFDTSAFSVLEVLDDSRTL